MNPLGWFLIGLGIGVIVGGGVVLAWIVDEINKSWSNFI